MRSFAILFALFALLIPACSWQPAQSQVPESGWEVSLVSSGGVSGGGGQTIVCADGKVFTEQWTDPSTKRNRVPIGKADSVSIQVLGKAMNDPKLVDLDFKHYSNMTMSLTWRHGDQERIYAWESNSPDLPPEIERAKLAFDLVLKSATEAND